MNILGSMYINTKKHMSPILPITQNQNRQAQLTQNFLEQWKQHQNIEPDELLENILSSASEQVPFYRQYFANNPHKDPRKLTDWPVLNRDHLWNEYGSLRNPDVIEWKTWTHASGGSTGRPVTVLHDEYFAAKASALRKLCSELFFEGPHYNQLILWGMTQEVQNQNEVDLKTRIKDEIRTLMGIKTSHINTFEFTKEKFEQCIHILDHQKPNFIFGYAGSVYELAKYIDEHGIEVTHKPQVIGTTAQTLHGFMRERIEKVFECRVADHYGSREVGPIAWQHEDGRMYFPKFFSRIEVVDSEGRPVAPGEQGRILVTTLHNFTMPLVRYDIGDTGVRGEDVTYRGYTFATLQKITGRSSEEFINRRGSRVCAPFFINLFYYRSWLDQFYIVQRDYDLVEIMYVPKAGYDAIPENEREELDARIKTVMTNECRIVWTKVDEIPTTKAGKRLFIRSEVSDEVLPEAAEGKPKGASANNVHRLDS